LNGPLSYQLKFEKVWNRNPNSIPNSVKVLLWNVLLYKVRKIYVTLRSGAIFE
jgi:hypothetical protein